MKPSDASMRRARDIARVVFCGESWSKAEIEAAAALLDAVRDEALEEAAEAANDERLYDERIKKVADALMRTHLPPDGWNALWGPALEDLGAAVEREILGRVASARRAAIEECAEVCDTWGSVCSRSPKSEDFNSAACVETAHECATRIRTLLEVKP